MTKTHARGGVSQRVCRRYPDVGGAHYLENTYNNTFKHVNSRETRNDDRRRQYRKPGGTFVGILSRIAFPQISLFP